jgi:hypothetical protein
MEEFQTEESPTPTTGNTAHSTKSVKTYWYACKLCYRAFKSGTELESHWTESHSNTATAGSHVKDIREIQQEYYGQENNK